MSTPAADFDDAIIGLGVGGLALGALLARSGRRVVAFERHEVPGGYGHSFRQGRYAFCAELHYVWDCGPGERVHRFLRKLGLDESVRFHRLEPRGFDRVVGPGVDYTIGSGFERERERLSLVFPEHGQALTAYYRLVAGIHRQMTDLPIGFTWATLLRQPRRYGLIIRHVRRTLQDLFDELRLPQALRLILAGQSAIFWLPPRDLSLLVHAAGVASYDRGAYAPEKSFMHVMRSLMATIRDAPGCRVMLSTEVVGLRAEGGVVRSATTAAGDTVSAKRFFFDGDAQLSLGLLGEESVPPRWRDKLRTPHGASVVSVYLGLKDCDLRRMGMDERNVFWHPELDLNDVYDHQLGTRVPQRPFFFCNSPTLRPHDASLAPRGCHQLVLVAPCSYAPFRAARDRSEDEYQALKATWAERMIAVAESELVPGVSARIEERVVGSPLTNERFVLAPAGNCYGTPLDPAHVHPRRLNHRSPFGNMHYVGASASLPGFATMIHFAGLLYEKLTGDTIG